MFLYESMGMSGMDYHCTRFLMNAWNSQMTECTCQNVQCTTRALQIVPKHFLDCSASHTGGDCFAYFWLYVRHTNTYILYSYTHTHTHAHKESVASKSTFTKMCLFSRILCKLWQLREARGWQRPYRTLMHALTRTQNAAATLFIFLFSSF